MINKSVPYSADRRKGLAATGVAKRRRYNSRSLVGIKKIITRENIEREKLERYTYSLLYTI